MKHIYRLVLFCLLISASSAWANSTHLYEIKGINGDILKNVQDRLATLKDSPDFDQKAQDNIRQALQPFGYFKSKINSYPLHSKTIFEITAGPALKIAHVDATLSGPGKDDPELQKFMRHFPLVPGQTFVTERYEQTKDDFFQVANNRGYIKAELTQKEIQISLKTYTANIILHFDTGPRYYFGHIMFDHSVYSPDFLKRFVTIQEHEPFSSQKLLKFQQSLRESRYFKEVETTPHFNQSDYTVPVNVMTTAPKSQRYDIGLGWGTFTGARLTLGSDFRRITDTGQHFSTQIKVSSVLTGITAKYFIPGSNPLTDQYTMGANVQYFAPKNGLSFSQSLSGSFVKTQEEWQRTFSLNYLTERYQVVTQPTRHSELFYPSMTVSFLKVDNKISPRFGNMVNFTIQGAHQDVLSKTNFLQGELKGKTIFSPTEDARVILRGDLGYTVVQDLNNLPLTLSYFAGGLGSVRGYPYSTLGPGKYLEVASAEFQHKIIGDWSGAVFYDVGNASNTFNSNFMRGDGAGIIYSSFIGPIKVYVGRAESIPGKPYRFEFSMGPDF